MKLMAFGDIHEYLHPLISLAEPLRQADVILVTGDMTRWRGLETATKVLQAIMHYNPNVLAQVGNTDSWEVHHHLNQCGINLHGQGHRLGEVGIFGVGGSNYTEFFQTHKVSQKTFQTALDQFGAQHLTELTALMGHYAQTAFFLNAFEVQLPEQRTEPVLSV